MSARRAFARSLAVAFALAGASAAAPGCGQGGARCTEIAARFRFEVAAGSGACTSSSECACFNPVAFGVGCGGVTGKASAARLSAIEAEFRAAGCPWPTQCAAQMCLPVCRAGRCGP